MTATVGLQAAAATQPRRRLSESAAGSYASRTDASSTRLSLSLSAETPSIHRSVDPTTREPSSRRFHARISISRPPSHRKSPFGCTSLACIQNFRGADSSAPLWIEFLALSVRMGCNWYDEVLWCKFRGTPVRIGNYVPRAIENLVGC